jgi:hypothetical protein
VLQLSSKNAEFRELSCRCRRAPAGAARCCKRPWPRWPLPPFPSRRLRWSAGWRGSGLHYVYTLPVACRRWRLLQRSYLQDTGWRSLAHASKRTSLGTWDYMHNHLVRAWPVAAGERHRGLVDRAQEGKCGEIHSSHQGERKLQHSSAVSAAPGLHGSSVWLAQGDPATARVTDRLALMLTFLRAWSCTGFPGLLAGGAAAPAVRFRHARQRQGQHGRGA